MNLFKKILLVLIALIIGYLSLIFFLGNERAEILELNDNQDILMRRNYLINRIFENSTLEIFQKLEEQHAGEWVIGSYAMTVYALTNIAMDHPETAQKSSIYIKKMIESSLNDRIKEFDKISWGEDPLDKKVLNSDQGHIAYYGHINLMLGAYALLNNDQSFQELHLNISDAIEKRLNKYSHRHAESYPFEVYPCDNTVAVASLRIAGMTLDKKYTKVINEWLEQTKKLEDPIAGLLPFQIDLETGKALQAYRGMHTGWNSFFLPLIDEIYAKELYGRSKKHLLIQAPGLAAFKEWESGNWFTMDRDTGPVVFGLGISATGFSIAGARWDKDKALLSSLLRTIELLGVTISKNNERHYLAMPIISDAIILAMKTAGPWRSLQ